MNSLIVDCEILNAVPPKWFKYDPDSDLPVGHQLYNAQKRALEEGEATWSGSYFNARHEAFLRDCVNPVTNKPYSYCKGWDDYEGMGISVIGVRDCLKRETLYFLGDDEGLSAFERLQKQRDFLIGFNNKKFDNNLLRANGLELKPSFDVLRALWRSSGLNPDEFTDNHKGYGLEQLAILNKVGRKPNSGFYAPLMWQQGREQEVIDYCLHDVEMVRQVLYRAVEGKLVHPISGELIKLTVVLEG